MLDGLARYRAHAYRMNAFNEISDERKLQDEKWGEQNHPDGTGRETLGMSVEVNHRFLDGVHLGRFYQTLQASIDALEP